MPSFPINDNDYYAYRFSQEAESQLEMLLADKGDIYRVQALPAIAQ